MKAGDSSYIDRAQYDDVVFEVLRLKEENASLKRLIFGTKSERFVPSESKDQLALFEAEKLHAEPVIEQIPAHTRQKSQPAKPGHGRSPLPDSLERVDVILEPEGLVEGMVCIGKEVTEELEYTPGKLFVRRYIRPKYVQVNPADDLRSQIIVAPLHSRPIDKGIPGPGLLAHLLVSKFVDHLPLYRQGKMFERLGMKIADNTLIDWTRAACQLIAPLYECLKSELLLSHYIQADETPLKVLDETKKGKTHQGYLWVYHAPNERLVLFEYQKGRAQIYPLSFLSSFTGILQSDGYTAYEAFETQKDVQLSSCMAHARRYFESALDNDPERAKYALTCFQNLYAVERTARDARLDYDQRLALRQKNARPHFDDFFQWLQLELPKLPPKMAISQAIAYALARKEKLARYLQYGHIEIDNNLVENAIRPVALGRKNYLFAGSHDAAQRIAMMYSFMASCQLNGINPAEWIIDVLTRISDTKLSELKSLLPKNWAKN